MPRVFISHSTQDRNFVEREIVTLLKEHGIEPWYAKDDIHTAGHWERDIVAGLKACEWFLVVLSPRSAQSEWVRDEVHWAIDNRPSRIIPVLQETCALDEFHLRLPRIQFVDFRDHLGEARKRLLQTLNLASTPAEAGVVICKGHEAGISNVVVCPDGRRLLTSSHDGTVRLWDLASGNELRSFLGHKGAVSSLAVSPDGRELLSGGSDRTIRLWEMETGRERLRLEGHRGWVLSLKFARNGTTALSGGGDTTLRHWDLCDGKVLRQFQAEPRGMVLSLAVSPTDCLVLSATGNQWQDNQWIAGSEHAVRMWDLDSGTLARRMEGHTSEISDVAFSPDGRLAASAGIDRTIRIWHVKSGKEMRRIEGHADEVWCVAFAPDGTRIASGGRDETVRIWDVASGKELQCLLGHAGPVVSVAMTQDGQRVISGSEDGTARISTPPALSAT